MHPYKVPFVRCVLWAGALVTLLACSRADDGGGSGGEENPGGGGGGGDALPDTIRPQPIPEREIPLTLDATKLRIQENSDSTTLSGTGAPVVPGEPPPRLRLSELASGVFREQDAERSGNFSFTISKGKPWLLGFAGGSVYSSVHIFENNAGRAKLLSRCLSFANDRDLFLVKLPPITLRQERTLRVTVYNRCSPKPSIASVRSLGEGVVRTVTPKFSSAAPLGAASFSWVAVVQPTELGERYVQGVFETASGPQVLEVALTGK